MKPIRVFLDTSPLQNGHAIRGVGMYTRSLATSLKSHANIELVNDPQHADIIHLPFFDLFRATLPSSLFLRNFLPGLRPRYIVTIHDVIPLLFPKAYKPGVRGRLFFWRQLLALRSVAAVLTDSHASKQDIVKYLHVPAHKVFVTLLAANPDLMPTSAAAVTRARQAYQLPKHYLLYVGDINYNKNLPQLIKALKFIPDEIHLVCVGRNFREQPIPEWQAISTQIALSDVSARVHVVTNLGASATEELSAVYTGAAAYVQPSLAEGFGLPVLEAMTCGTPVVCAQNSSLIEVGGDHAVWVQTDAESIAEGVKIVLDWPTGKRAQWIAAAQKWAAGFTWTKTAVATVAVYQHIQKGEQ